MMIKPQATRETSGGFVYTSPTRYRGSACNR